MLIEMVLARAPRRVRMAVPASLGRRSSARTCRRASRFVTSSSKPRHTTKAKAEPTALRDRGVVWAATRKQTAANACTYSPASSHDFATGCEFRMLATAQTARFGLCHLRSRWWSRFPRTPWRSPAEFQPESLRWHGSALPTCNLQRTLGWQLAQAMPGRCRVSHSQSHRGAKTPPQVYSMAGTRPQANV